MIISQEERSFTKILIFKYLDSSITLIKYQRSEIDQHIPCCNRFFFQKYLNSGKIFRNNTIKVSNTIRVPLRLGHLQGTQKKYIEKFERKIIISGTIWGHSTNALRRETSISHNTKARRLKWVGHLARSNPSGSLKRPSRAPKAR